MAKKSKTLDANPFVDSKDLYTGFSEAKVYTIRDMWQFPEWERAARNDPLPVQLTATKKKLRNYNDGTLSFLIESKAKRLFKKMPTARVNSGDPFLDIIAEFILNKEIIPNCRIPARPLQKLHDIVYKALIYGNQPIRVHYRNDEYWHGYSGPDFEAPDIRDVYISPGSRSIADSNIVYMSEYFSPAEIKKKTLQLRKLAGAKKVENGWRIKNLERAAEKRSTRSAEGLAPQYKQGDNDDSEYVHLVNVYQRGIKSYFYLIDPVSENIVRKWRNPDPRGDIPFKQMYYSFDTTSPMGRGAVQRAAPLQSFLDALQTIVAYVTAYNTSPMSISKGLRPPQTIKFEMGTHVHVPSPDFDFDFYPIQSPAIDNFPIFAEMLRGQILLLANSASTAAQSGVSSEKGSKTSQGVDFQFQERQHEDFHVRQNAEETMGDIYEDMLSLKLSTEKGKQRIKVDKDTKNKILSLPDIHPNTRKRLEETDIVIFNYSAIKDELVKVEIDLGSSALVDAQQLQNRYRALVEMLGLYPPLQKAIRDDSIAKGIVYSMEFPHPEVLLSKIALEGNEEEFKRLTDDTVAQMQQIAQETYAQLGKPQTEADMIKALGAIIDLVPWDVQQQLLERYAQVGPSGPPPAQQELDLERGKALITSEGEEVPDDARALILGQQQAQTTQTNLGNGLTQGLEQGLPPAQALANAIVPPAQGGGQAPQAPAPPAENPLDNVPI